MKGLLILAVAACGILQAGAPRVFYSDLDSGPATGGPHNAGAFVTIYGAGFGRARGESQVTVGGEAVASYLIWNDSQIAFQLGSRAKSGQIVVNTAQGTSNGVPFTVRAGRLYFVSLDGKDENPGSFSAPFRTLPKARDALKPGDIAYARDGVSQLVDDGNGWRTCLLIRDGGKPGLPKAIVAFPGATVTLGDAAGQASAIRSKDNESTDYWTFVGLQLRGMNEAVIISGSNHWRIVNSDITCPNGNGASACVEGGASWVQFYGNRVHDTGKATASALYHAVYFTTDSNHIDIGWNAIFNVRGCRGIQFHSSMLHGGPQDPSGHNQYDLSVHDNVIHDTQCDAIIFATVDPSKGKVEAYNNIIYNAGLGPNNPERTGGWTCINVPGTTNNGPAGSGSVEVRNNTMFNCGGFRSPPYGNANAAVLNGGGNPNLRVHLERNIVVQSDAAPYLISGSSTGIYGSNNLFYGHGAPPTFPGLSGSISQDPLFLNPGARDFSLKPESPARRIQAGAQ